MPWRIQLVLNWKPLLYLLLNEVCFPDVQQAKRWVPKVCHRQRVYSWGRQVRRGENKGPQRWRAWDIYGIKKQGGLRHGEGWLEARKWWSNQCSVQVYLSYTHLHGMHVQKVVELMWAEGGVLSRQLSKDGQLDTHTGRWSLPVWTGQDWLQFKQLLL